MCVDVKGFTSLILNILLALALGGYFNNFSLDKSFNLSYFLLNPNIRQHPSVLTFEPWQVILSDVYLI